MRSITTHLVVLLDSTKVGVVVSAEMRRCAETWQGEQKGCWCWQLEAGRPGWGGLHTPSGQCSVSGTLGRYQQILSRYRVSRSQLDGADHQLMKATVRYLHWLSTTTAVDNVDAQRVRDI